jgi:5-aminolevulinate synthase
MYGPRGAGVAERDGVAHRITVMQATLAKAVGVVGGYIAGTANMVDFVRSFGQGFIFTSSLPPGVAAGAARSIQILKTAQDLRTRHQERAKTLTQKLLAAGIPAMETPSHIVPVIVGDATLCKKATDMLMSDFNVYVQPINYPTVAKGTERLRFTATPLHSDEEIDHLVYALTQVWNRLGLQMAAQ